MKVEKTILDGVVIIEPDVFPDERGYFFEIAGALQISGNFGRSGRLLPNF